MTHLKTKVSELIAQWKAKGFGGMPVDAHNGDSLEKHEVVHIPGDPRSPSKEDAELTEEEWENRCRDYAIAVVNPDFFTFRPRRENDYVTVEIDEGQWWSDFLAHCQVEVGTGVEIKHHKGTNEVEFMRKSPAPTKEPPKKPCDHQWAAHGTNTSDRELTQQCAKCKEVRTIDKCPSCNSTNTEVKREGMTGTLGRVICSDCGTDIREWDAY